ncbi:MAG: hypothetical protein EXR54_04645 [Dehalococcoidia bacterium]|nr:hypothetical protein [Dehalococcoidia bacterium]MSQ16840.1 hypothetical protein [Dehalococcoidia bacterium]
MARVGEVTQTASTGFTVQCYKLYAAPALGALVRAGGTPASGDSGIGGLAAGSSPNPLIPAGHGQQQGFTGTVVYGVVCRVSTEPLDPGRPVLARGESAATEEELYRSNPQLERLLTSRFEVLIIGHQDAEGSRPFLPPLPPRVHSFVYGCNPEEVAQCTARLDFLHLLLGPGLIAADEVVGACLRGAAQAHSDPDQFLLRAGRALAGELAQDLPRLNAILHRVAPW